MIYVNVYYKDQDTIERVEVSYPDERDFMSGLINEVITPPNEDKITVDKGVYDPLKGFYQYTLQITGVNEQGKAIKKTIPMTTCIITEYL